MPNLVRAFIIGSCNWLFVDLLVWPLAHHRSWSVQPLHVVLGWPYVVFAIAASTAAGFPRGDWLASQLLGDPTPTLLQRTVSNHPELLYILFVPSVSIVIGMTALRAIATRARAADLAKILAAEAQLRLLESQLNPHMQHSVKDEFDRVSDYLYLMQIRMGDRLSFRMVLPPALADLQMPSLLLQPLVENAIQHGLEPSVPGGKVHVSAAQSGSHLILRVRDSGVNRDLGTKVGSGFGLQHVRERLLGLYGSKAVFGLELPENNEPGAIAVVRLPMSQPT